MGVSGHVWRFEGKRRPVWRAKYRLPDGREVKKTLGPAWRPEAAHRLATSPSAPPKLGFARPSSKPPREPSPEWSAPAPRSRTRDESLRYIEQDRQRKPSTLRDYDSIFRNHVIPHLGSIHL